MTIEVSFTNQLTKHTVLVEDHEKIYDLENKIRNSLGYPQNTKIVITLGTKRLYPDQLTDIFYDDDDDDKDDNDQKMTIHIIPEGSHCCCPDKEFCFV